MNYTRAKQTSNVHTLVLWSNSVAGPYVCWDYERHCYGLKADRDYRPGEKVTQYGGHKSVKPSNGDYVAKSGEVYIDGLWDFCAHEKGRWINESDNQRTLVNVKLARDVRALVHVYKDEWFFADYGPEYVRDY